MADKFSLDGILAEIEQTKARRETKAADAENPFAPSVDEILAGKKRIARSPASEKAELESQKLKSGNSERVSAAKEEKKKAPLFEKPKPKKPAQDMSVTAILAENPAKEKHEAEKTAEKISPKPFAPERKMKSTDSFSDEKKSIRPNEKKTFKNRMQPPEKAAEEVISSKKSEALPTAVKEKQAEKTETADFSETDEKEAKLATGSIEMNDVKPKLLFVEPEADEKPKPSRMTYKPDEKLQEKKQENLLRRQLQKEEELEDPDDLFDAMNPIEVRNKAAADFDDFLSGDTMGIAGNELRELSKNETKEKKDTVITAPFGAATTENVKTYTPSKDSGKAKGAQGEVKRRSNTALLESLNKALDKRRETELSAEPTLPDPIGAPAATEGFSALAAPTSGLNIDYTNKLIQDTTSLPASAGEEKIRGMETKRKRKIRDFVLEGDEEEEEIQEEDEPDSVEFDSYDTTGQIWSDLCESHKGLKARFVILLVLTVFLGAATVLSDFGKDITFGLFGIDITFLDRRHDPNGFIYFNLITGVIAAVICSSVLLNGISKLFKGKADCDTVCSVLSVTALVMTIFHLSNFDYLQRGRAFLYVLPALGGLLFNTLGKLLMIVRAKRNFRFISGDSVKYSTQLIDDDATSSAFTKGVVNEVPCLAAMRKTEFLTDFLRSSYCEDKADRLSRIIAPASIAAAIVFGALAYFVSGSIEEAENKMLWATSVACATLAVLSPFSIMFIVNLPLSRAGKALAKSDAAVLGYASVEEFSGVNAVMVDASALFPAGTTVYSNIKHCKQPNSINSVALDQAIILAASLAIKSGSALSNMFRDMINDKDEILAKVENCVYEDNMGILGWYGNKRMIMGNREQMKHHDIKIPDMSKVKKYQTLNTDTIYLAVGGEIVIMFFVELIANSEIKSRLQRLTEQDVSIVIKTTDSIMTVNRLAELFDISPDSIRILPYSMHGQFSSCTKYISRSSGSVSGNGTFTSFSAGLLAVKSLSKDIGLASCTMLGGMLLGGICAAALGIFGRYELITPANVFLWNTVWLLITAAAASLRKY